jgi:carbonic anhydrase/acetyltransferase-like protein (isoleucine patch superfamily)
VNVEFIKVGNMVKVIETFDAENENSAQQQKQGWQSILNNFKEHVESKSN